MTQKIYCIFHRVDQDGYLGGSLIKYALNEKFEDHETILIGKNYYDDMSDIKELITKDDIVFMVDFSMENEYMQWIYDNSKLFVWLDHHETSIKNVDMELQSKLEGIRDKKYSGVELAWLYFYENRPMPYIVKAVGRYDVFDKSNEVLDWEKEILPMQYGLKEMSLNPLWEGKYEIWEQWLDFELYNKKILEYKDTYKAVKSNGWAIKKYKQSIQRLYKSYAFTGEIEGYKALIINTPTRNSLEFQYLIEKSDEKFDVLLAYVFNGNEYVCSIYDNDCGHDVSLIAENNNGGGHKGAAGFRVNDIFKVIKNIEKLQLPEVK